jgi:hypothetical protein
MKMTLICVLALAACSTKGSTNGDAGADRDAGSTDGGADAGADAGPAAAMGWDDAKIGGGGFVTGGTVAADGTKFFRTDTSGCYVYDDTTGHFSRVVPRNLPAGVNVAWNGGGCFEAMIAGSNSQILYAAYNNAVYRSGDRGATFATATKTDFAFDSNSGNLRTLERHGQVDPHNPDHVIFGDTVALYRTTDGGRTWSKPLGLPAAASFNGDTAGFSGIAFNPKAARVGGLTSEVIVSTGGRFFRSTDEGASFTEISTGGPTGEPRAAEFDGKGRYFTSLDPKGLWVWQNGWTDLHSPDQGDTTFFIDPQNDDHIVVNNGFNVPFASSTNAGGTWSGANWAQVNQASVDGIAWHGTNPHYYPANILVDAAHSTVWMPGGNQGVASFTLASLYGAGPYTAQMHGVGVENICANVIVAPKGSKKLHVAVWDESYGQLDRDNVTYPSVFNNIPGNFGPSWGLDVSREDPKFLARWLSTSKFAQSGWTDDDGVTWHPFATLPAGVTDIETQWGYGGTVAYSGKDNIIIVSSNTNNATGSPRMPYYTLDRGATWKPVTLPTGAWTLANIAQLHFAYYLNREILVADHATLGRFYFLVMSPDASIRGVYATSDGGATWTLTHTDLPTGFWGFNAHLESPVANHLWMGGGDEGRTGAPGSGPLYRSTDGGVTFTALPDVLTPIKFAFGAPAHPGGYPVLFMQGYYKGKAGVWMSPDADKPSPTWISIGAAPNGQWTQPRHMAADPDVPGRLWVGTSCAGVQFGQFGGLL